MDPTKIEALEQHIRNDCGNIPGIVVRKNGEVRYERYFNGCTADSPTHVFSVTKSVLALLIGIAIDEGMIRGVEQKVLDFFPEYAPGPGQETARGVTLWDLLTMTAPFQYEEEPYEAYFSSGDWVRSALSLLGGTPHPGVFRYRPLVGPDILSGILTRATGRSVLDFARERLFSPLGISVADSLTFRDQAEQMAFYQSTGVSCWVADPKGVNTAGWGLTLTAGDMAKIGQLCLDGGRWNGTQLVSAQWIRESTREQVRWAEQNLPYGYLWWVMEHGFAAMGDGGNVIYADREKGLAVAITSLMAPEAGDRIGLIQTHIEPLFSDEA